MEDFTPGTLKAFQVALVEPVAYLEDSVNDFLTKTRYSEPQVDRSTDPLKHQALSKNHFTV
jgi:hypothetical protein